MTADPVRRAEDGATTPNVERCALCYARRDPPEVSALIAKQKLVPRRFVKGATDALLCSYCVAECIELLKEPAESGPPPAEDGARETEPRSAEWWLRDMVKYAYNGGYVDSDDCPDDVIAAYRAEVLAIAARQAREEGRREGLERERE